MRIPDPTRPTPHPEGFEHCVLCGDVATYVAWDMMTTWQAPIMQTVIDGNAELEIGFDQEECVVKTDKKTVPIVYDMLYLCDEHKK